MPLQAVAALATLLAAAPHGNRVELKLDHGSAELVWVSAGTFRFRRVLEGALPKVDWTEREAVPFEIVDTKDAIYVRTHAIEVTLRKQGALVSVQRFDGVPLMEDLSEPRSEAAGVVWERKPPAGTEFYGLGPRAETTFGLRGRAVRAERPFLGTTAGYGEFHAGAGAYRFDFTAPDRYRIQGNEIDYFFYFGPTPKEIFEEHHAVEDAPTPWNVPAERFSSWSGLRASLVRILQGAMSAAITPVFDLGIYATAPEELKSRARQLGSLVARVTPGAVGKSGFRTQLDTFYGSYVAELQDRGFPVWHPLPFQFPNDPDAGRYTDEFMLGDELLIAPILEPGEKRSVYLPRGVWTSLETNAEIKGPATIDVTTKSLPVWAKNGSIVPLDSRGSIGLHYFPKSGGEFFLLEGDIADYTQAHASPALDFYRLEIESKKDRDYQWVVHHMEKPIAVGFEESKYREVQQQGELEDRCWWYDAAQKNLHVRVKVKAGEDNLINVAW
jgi:hypothetical protein